MTTKVADTILGKVARMQNDLFRRVREGSLNSDIAIRELQKIIEGVNPYADSPADWQNFWKGIDGKDHDFSSVRILEKPEGNWRLLVIDDIALETLYVKCKERFKCWRWTNDNLDKIVTYNERDAKNGPYAIWVRDEIEVDEKYKNISADQIKEMSVKTETLAERLIHELKYFKETSKHLDIRNRTLCAGSRCSDGGVPGVRWSGDDGEMDIYWCYSSGVHGCLRSREVVS